MCGFGAVVDYNSRVERWPLKQMAHSLAHRGPDGEGFHFSDCLGLAFRRLAVIDLSHFADQPMLSEDGRYTLVYNGEIYNYQELRSKLKTNGVRFLSHGDSEVLLQVLIHEGEAGLKKLKGMFAFFFWDNEKQVGLAARDRLGIKPLFYAAEGRRLILASELNALMSSGLIEGDLNPVGMAGSFRYLFVPAPWTIYKNVFKLLPGHLMSVSDEEIEIKPYWRPRPHPPQPAPENDDEWIEAYDAVFDRAVKDRLMADVPVGAFISGGLDSSLVAVRAALGSPGLSTFTVTFPGSTADESGWANRVREALGTQHHEAPLDFESWADGLAERISYFGEPFAISSALAVYSLAQLARREVIVALSGDGGDETLGGYPWRHGDDWISSWARWLPRGLGRHLTTHRGKLGRLARGAAAANEGGRYEERLAPLAGWDEVLLVPELVEAGREARQRFIDIYGKVSGSTLTKRLTTEIATTLPDEMLTKVDRMSMAHSLEVRVPFLDHGLVELALALPDHLKVSHSLGKVTLRRLAERHLPPELAGRSKHGFNVPLNEWFKKGFERTVREIVDESELYRSGFLEPSGITKLFRARNENGLFALLVFGLWLKRSR